MDFKDSTSILIKNNTLDHLNLFLVEEQEMDHLIVY